MAHKYFKSQAAAVLLHQEINMYFINPVANKIDFKMLTKNLFENDEYANLELNPSLFKDSSNYSNKFIAAFGTLADVYNK